MAYLRIEKPKCPDTCEACAENRAAAIKYAAAHMKQRDTESLRQIRKILANEHQIPAQEIFDSGVVPIIIEHLRTDAPLVMNDIAVHIITNITCSDREEIPRYLVDNGAAQRLLDLMNHYYYNAPYRHVLWAISNMCNGNRYARDWFIREGLMLNLAKRTRAIHMRDSDVKAILWAVCCVLNPPSNSLLCEIACVLPFVGRIFARVRDDYDACREYFTVVCRLAKISVPLVIRMGLVEHVVSGLSGCAKRSALIAATNIVFNRIGARLFIDSGGVSRLLRLLQDENTQLYSYICLTGLAGTTAAQVESFLECGVFIALNRHFCNSAARIQGLAVRIVIKSVDVCVPDQARRLLWQGGEILLRRSLDLPACADLHDRALRCIERLRAATGVVQGPHPL